MRESILFFLIIIATAFPLFSQNVSLELSGDEKAGFDIDILYGNQKVTTNKKNGEFKLIIENADRSISDTLYRWKADKAEESSNGIKLSGQYFSETLMTLISIEVAYSIVNEHVIKKEISLEQNNIPLLILPA